MIRPNQPPELEEMERDGEFLAEYAEYVANLYHVAQRVESGAAMDGDRDRCAECSYESEPT